MSCSKLFYVLITSLYFFGGHLSAEISKEATTVKSDHGDSFFLGKLNILGKEFNIYRLGDFIPGEEGAFEVTTTSEVAGFTAYFWVESQDGKRLNPPVQASFSDGKTHFHVLTKHDAVPFRVVVRLQQGQKDERGSLPLSAPGEEH